MATTTSSCAVAVALAAATGCLTPPDLAETDDELSVVVVAAGPHALAPRQPGPLAPLGQVTLPGSIYRLDLEGDLAAVGMEYVGLSLVDVAHPSAPQVRSTVYLGGAGGGAVYDVELADGIVYIANNTAGLRVYDATDPGAPTEIIHLPASRFGASVLGVEVDGDRLFVSSGGGGVSIWDVGDPYALAGAGSCYNGHVVPCNPATTTCAPTSALLGCYAGFPSTGYFHDVIVDGDLAYAGEALTGFQLLDVTDPAHVSQLAAGTGIPGQPLNLALDGDHLWGASYGYGLAGVDVGGPIPAAWPLAAAWSSSPSQPLGVAAAHGRGGAARAYLATSTGLAVLDVAGAPTLVTTLLPGTATADVEHAAGRLYVGAGTTLRIFDDGV
ncbi:MAG: hypothetical protein R2939_06220 [Kofleriaceae bacterium]